MIAAATWADWLSTFRPCPDAALRFICFPYAGGSASLFARWHLDLPPQVEVSAIRLPGRSGRADERIVAEWPEIVPPLCAALRPFLDRPFALFGHSLGALISFEVARFLRRQGHAPQRLIVSGRRAPHLPSSERMSCATIEELADRLRRLNGTPSAILEDPQLFALVAPRIQADFQLADSYVHVDAPRLDCPITAIGGADDEESQEGRLDAWQRHTSGAFSAHVLEGDHFFLHSREREVLALIRHDLWKACGDVTKREERT